MFIVASCRAQDAKVIKQNAPPSCGVVSVVNVLYLLGRSEESLEQAFIDGASCPKTMSMIEIRDFASRYGLELSGVACGFSELTSDLLPAILWLDEKHFCVLEYFDDEYARVGSSFGVFEVLPLSEVKSRYSGKALIMNKSADKLVFVEEPVVQHGSVVCNSNLDTLFVLSGDGGNPVSYKGVRTPCQTQVTPDMGVVGPEKDFGVIVSCPVPAMKTTLQETVSLLMERGSYRRRVLLSFLASAVPPFVVNPGVLRFGDVSAGGEYHAALHVSNIYNGADKVSLVTDHNEVDITTRTSGAEGESVTYDVLVKPENAGKGMAKLMLKAGGDMPVNQAHLEIPVYWNAIGDVRVEPAKITFGFIENGKKSAVQKVRLKSTTGETVLVRIKSPESLVVDKLANDDADGVILSVAVSEKAKKGLLKEEIVVELANGMSARVPVSAYID